MQTPNSYYSIEVGDRSPEGEREIRLKYNGSVVFRTHHREIQWVFLANFPAGKSSMRAPPHTANDTFNRLVSTQVTLADVVSSASQNGAAYVSATTLVEYLCVFHKEELRDKRGRFTQIAPSLVCTSYAVSDGTMSEFTLTDVVPSNIVPGVVGVYIHGKPRRPTLFSSSATTTLLRNLATPVPLLPAQDLWWMSSPLEYSPVALRVTREEAVKFSTHPGYCEVFTSPAPEGENVSPAETLPTADSGKAGSLPELRRQTEGSALRSISPVPSGQPRGGLKRVNRHGASTLLGEFVAGGATPRHIAVVRVGANHDRIGLSLTVAHTDLGVAEWEWLPRATCTVPDLAATANAHLSVVVSDHPSLERQVLFLQDSARHCVHVIRTPHLELLNEPLQYLFCLDGGSFPTVVPSALGTLSPQPVAVFNYPADGYVTLYSPRLLAQDLPGSATVGEANYLYRCDLASRAMSFRSGSSSSRVAHRVEKILYQTHATVALSLCPSTCPPRTLTTTATTSSSFEYVHVFSSLQTEDAQMTALIFDTLLAMGSSTVSALQDALLSLRCHDVEARSAGDGRPLDELCGDLLLNVVRRCRDGENEEAAELTVPSSEMTESTGEQHTHSGGETGASVEFNHALFDPFYLTVDSVASLCISIQKQVKGNGDSPELATRVSTSLEGGDKNGVKTTENSQGVAEVLARQQLRWSVEEACVCVMCLHLLSESCRLQEQYWSLLPRLCRLIFDLSCELGLEHFVAVYHPMVRDEESTRVQLENPPRVVKPPVRLSDAIRSEVVQQLFTPHLLDPDAVVLPSTVSSTGGVVLSDFPPLILNLLLDIFHNKTANKNGTAETSDDISSSWWPMLRVAPEPIRMANRVYTLYRDCFHSSFTECKKDNAFSWWEFLVRGCVFYGISPRFVRENLTIGVAYPLLRAFLAGRDLLDDTVDWSDALYAAVGRLDRVSDHRLLLSLTDPADNVLRDSEQGAVVRLFRATVTDDDGVNMRSDFPKMWNDNRVETVQVLLNTAAVIAIPSQHDDAAAQDAPSALQTAARRALATPVGRGIFTMCTQNFKIRDSVPIPKLNLDGITAEGVRITNSAEDMQHDRLMWPLFHNGCAAGLRFLPLASRERGGDGLGVGGMLSATRNSRSGGVGSGVGGDEDNTITRHWVVYQTRNISCVASRAGLLLAAGVLGHLRVLQLTDIYSLLASPQTQYVWREATTIAVMLGLSCSFLGTNNDLVFRCLSMHIQSLTPTAEDIEISLEVQTAALVSIGFLCMRTPTNGFLVEMYLIEMSRLPSDEHCIRREGYALGAGIGLGMLLLGLGSSHGIASVEDRLLSFMNGERRMPAPSSLEGLEHFHEVHDAAGHSLTVALLNQNVEESFQCHCTRVHEGEYYNVAVSGPAACMALGLMYLHSNDAVFARKVALPNQCVALQRVTPVMCLLRTLMCSVILWDAVEASTEWLHGFAVPARLMELSRSHPEETGLHAQQVQYLTMNLGYSIAGATLALGLRYAGSMDNNAKSVILAELNGFLKGRIGSTATPATSVQQTMGVFETCVSACAVALSLVMAGTGDLAVFSVLKRLQQRSTASYGAHMSISMALGFLFLGGGTLTLATTPVATAALLVALYPVWPQHAEDTTAHLQALRHLYAMAVVPRVLRTIDARTLQPISVPVRIVMRSGNWKPSFSPTAANLQSSSPFFSPLPHGMETREVRLRTPCLYPPADMIDRMEFRSPSHYALTVCAPIDENEMPLVYGDGQTGATVGGGRRYVSAVNSKRRSQAAAQAHRTHTTDRCPDESGGAASTRLARHSQGDALVQVITDSGLTVRLMEREGEHGAVPERVGDAPRNDWRRNEGRFGAHCCHWSTDTDLSGASDGKSYETCYVDGVAGRLQDWMTRLRSIRRLSTTEAVTILTNVKLLTAVEQAIRRAENANGNGRGSTASTCILPLDLSNSLQVSLAKRYSFLFLRGPRGSEPQHPLHQLLVQRLPWSVVVSRVAAAAHTGTPGFPCAFPCILSATDLQAESRPRDTSLEPGDGVREVGDLSAMYATGNPTRCVADFYEPVISRWLAEALSFFGIQGQELALHQYRLQWQTLASEARGPRMTLLLQLSRQLGLSVPVLEQIFSIIGET